MEKLNEKLLKEVNGGNGITEKELYAFNKFVKAVNAKLDAYKEAHPNMSQKELEIAKNEIANQVYESLNPSDKLLVDSFIAKLGNVGDIGSIIIN